MVTCLVSPGSTNEDVCKGLSIIVNVKLSVQNIFFYGEGGGSMGEKNVDSVHFQHVSPFFIVFVTNYPFKKS